MIGFSIVKDFYDYDFELIMKMNDEVRTKVSSISIGELSNTDILNYLSNYDTSGFPAPAIDYDVINSPINRILLSVDDVVSLDNEKDDYKSIFNLFSYLNRFIYRLTNISLVLSPNQKIRQALALVTVVPDFNNINDEIITLIEPALIEGLKYFVQTPYTNPDDMQSTSIILNRYNYEKQRLMDMFPTNDARLYKGAWL